MDGSPTLKGGLAALAIGFVILVAISETGLRFVFPTWSEYDSGRFIAVEPVPGHSPVGVGRVGFDGYFAQNAGDFRVHISINDFGLRNRDSVTAANDRIWIIGDSMAFGWGVEEDETYTSVAARESGLATYNVASPGTDVCGYQSLRNRMPESLRPKAIVVGLILENDIMGDNCTDRAAKYGPAGDKFPASSTELLTLEGLKIFLTRQSALYNFLAVSLKRVGPVVEILKFLGVIITEHYYKLTFDAEKTDALVSRTADELRNLKAMFADGVAFAVLIAPGRHEIRDGDPLYKNLRRSMSAALESRGVSVIDPIEQFKNAGFASTHFVHDGHWSPLGHEIAGKAVAKWMSVAGLRD